MPPTSAMRKTQQPAEQNRRSSGRQIRTSISRPANYYARPFGSVGGGGGVADEAQDEGPPGFFPAIQHFTDCVAALPKEVMRHFTLMKEVEAKIHGPTQALSQAFDRIKQLPPPPRRSHEASQQLLLSFTANNSTGANSANASVNGATPGLAPPPIADPAAQVAEPTPAEQQADMQRRHEYHNLRMTIGSILANLDERNVCLAEANRTLNRQLGRMDQVLPFVEQEIGEEARLGSLTHWAYADNKKKADKVPERTRRDVAATSSLVAAAAAIHEGDIAAARNEGREKTTKRAKAQHVDSEFEDRGPPKKSHHKSKKAAESADAKGASNAANTSQPAKKRKTEKTGGASMERTASAAGKTPKGQASASRTPASSEPAKKKSKPPVPPLVKKTKASAGSPAQSPRMPMASPTMANFSFPGESSGARPASRMRQASSSLQHSTSASRNSPPIAYGDKKVNGDKRSSDPKTGTIESVEPPEDVDMTDADGKTHVLAGIEAALGDKATSDGTAGHSEAEGSAAMTRTRSNGVGRGSDPPAAVSKSSVQHEERSHSRGGSCQHILKQIASYNKSPRTARREMEQKMEARAASAAEERAVEPRPVRTGRATRRHEESRVRTPEEQDDEEAEGEEDNPDDPDEPKYCYCGRGSFGTMIGCENDTCEKEWFHLECTGLKEVPDDNTKWYCKDCDPRGDSKRKPRRNGERR